MDSSKLKIIALYLNPFLMVLGILVSLYFHFSTQNNIAERDKKNIENERNNIRTMFAYEISHNQSSLKFLEGTKNVGFNKEKCQEKTCTPSAVELNIFADIRLRVLNSLRDDVYTIYLPQIYLLEQKEVSLIMNYYYSQKELLQNSKAIQIELSQNRENKKWLEEKTNLLNHDFENEYSLGEQILLMYKAYIPNELVDKR
ncbi:hypothetical protein [Proteus terrae]|uniref:hypothetical protein n=1 Tax=Proteus terrae TaxID=1574161 RepID=UPI0018C4F10C|nr:hypothetical protein [Proteus terrae]MBG2836107.1 hypothetical protein [Proteus terrae subsp. cibarius]MBG2867249.1 hypothetical protein [Proteus terrae subsp. cibarius]